MTAGLVLAAGAGTRFGDDPKLLADLHGRPVVEHVVRAAVAALDPVVVVLGARAREVRAHADLAGAEVTICPGWADGQAASLRHGLAALAGADRVVVLLGDQPLVTPALVARMAAEPPGSRAAHDGVPGHPVVLGPEQIAAARALRGDRGLRDLAWRLVETGDPAAARDIDIPDDLEAIRDEARSVL
jgi:CTP:molybdopterin cytidylyltransferase MocA